MHAYGWSLPSAVRSKFSVSPNANIIDDVTLNIILSNITYEEWVEEIINLTISKKWSRKIHNIFRKQHTEGAFKIKLQNTTTRYSLTLYTNKKYTRRVCATITVARPDLNEQSIQ